MSKKDTMTFGPVLRLLQSEGLHATKGRVRYALLAGKVPRPDTDGAGNMMFTKKDITAIRAHLKKPVKLGRPKAKDRGY